MSEVGGVRELVGEVAVGGVVPVLRGSLAVQDQVLGLGSYVAQPPQEQRQLLAIPLATGRGGSRAIHRVGRVRVRFG